MSVRSSSRCAAFAVLLAALAGCTPTPVLKPAAAPIDIAPDAGAVADGRYHDANVVWGGQIVEVRNRAEVTEILIDAYPLDAGQRPQTKKDKQGRFVAVLPGYAEGRDFRQGRFLSVTGTLAGSSVEPDGEKPVPVVLVADSHLWPPGFPNSGPEVHFAVGVSGGIR